MRLFSFSFLLGTLIIQFLPQLPASIWIGLFLSISIFLGTLSNKKPISRVFLITSALLAGLLLSSVVAKNQLDKRIPQKWEGQDIILQGQVKGIPNNKKDGTRFRFTINQAALKTKPEEKIALKGIVRLGWYQSRQIINADETWKLVVRMKRPSGFLNPGGFDYEKWLFTERISATGYIREEPEINQRLKSPPWWSVDHLRQTIHQKIQTGVEDKASAAILSALIVAVRTKFDDKQWKLLQQTGTSHLVAISGLHIAVVAGFAFLPIMLIWGLFPSLNEKIPLQVAGALTGVVFATAHAMLAGFTLPTQRALLMVVVALLALLVRKNYQPSSILAVVVIAVLLLDPLAGMTVSFWLSFLAVAMILVFIKRQIDKPKSKIMGLVKLQIFLSLGMLPLTLFFFGSASLLSPVANLIAIPWVSLVVVPLSLIALVFMPISTVISNGILSVSALAIKWMFAGFELLANSPLANITVAEIPKSYLVIAFLGFLFMLFPKSFPAKWLGLIAILPALLFMPAKPKKGGFTFTLLDAGQGMASIVQTKNHTLIYDVGTRYSETYDIGKLVVVPYLKSKGVERVDSMMLSHNDIDHWGGAEAILKEFVVDEVISSDAKILGEKEVVICVKGQHWQWDGVNFEILSPPSITEVQFKKDNNKSCVLRVSNAYHSVLLTGDIEKKTEKLLLKMIPRKLESEVFSVPHHGSKTSSTKAFLKAVSPKLALIPAGYRNRFGHPKNKVLKRYKKLEIAVMDTIESGAITVKFSNNEKEIEVNSYRERKKGFWSR
jgi:competence protein ComEC